MGKFNGLRLDQRLITLVLIGSCLLLLLCCAWIRHNVENEKQLLEQKVQEYAWLSVFAKGRLTQEEAQKKLKKEYEGDLEKQRSEIFIEVKDSAAVGDIVRTIKGSGCDLTEWSVYKDSSGWKVRGTCSNFEQWKALLEKV